MNNRGFTLIELIAVMLIMSVLTAITVPKIITFTHNAERKAVELGAKELNTRIYMYWLNTRASFNEDEELPSFDLGTGYTITNNSGKDISKIISRDNFEFLKEVERKNGVRLKLKPNRIHIDYTGVGATYVSSNDFNDRAPHYVFESWD